jgi:hypothetical protein
MLRTMTLTRLEGRAVLVGWFMEKSGCCKKRRGAGFGSLFRATDYRVRP